MSQTVASIRAPERQSVHSATLGAAEWKPVPFTVRGNDESGTYWAEIVAIPYGDDDSVRFYGLHMKLENADPMGAWHFRISGQGDSFTATKKLPTEDTLYVKMNPKKELILMRLDVTRGGQTTAYKFRLTPGG